MILVIVFPPSLGVVVVVVVVVVGESSITINFLTINVRVLCVCGVLGRAEDDDEGAQFPFVTLAREFEKNPSSLIILQLLLFE